LWMLGEMGLAFPSSIKNSVDAIASFRNSTEPILRERAINALGRIGRGCFNSVEPYWDDLFRFAHDEDASVRLAFIWASENIATNTPDPYKDHMPLFAELLHDSDDRVRMEAPEIFRVLGKRKPDFVKPYIERLRNIAETDSNRVVKIHCQGAIRAVE
ncbi:MAG: sister chromatid cohesion protein PDS5, partial [Paludibacteraceae bacterium]|nr:sister chromatid cohesion protein PDS5 [Paludibacteraceae bacterium]